MPGLCLRKASGADLGARVVPPVGSFRAEATCSGSHGIGSIGQPKTLPQTQYEPSDGHTHKTFMTIMAIVA